MREKYLKSGMGKRYLKNRLKRFLSLTGFTLLETILVLAIMTMFFAVSIPLFSKFTEKTKLETSARSVTSALRTARVYAITNNKPYYVFFDTTTNPDSYYVTDTDTANPAIAIDKVYKLPIGIEFVEPISFGAGSNRASFKATGELNETANDTSVVLQEEADSTIIKTITVERTTGRTIIQ